MREEIVPYQTLRFHLPSLRTITNTITISVGHYLVSKWEIPLLGFVLEWSGNAKSGKSHFWVLPLAAPEWVSPALRSPPLVFASFRNEIWGSAQSDTLAQQSSPSALDPSFVARQPKAKPAASLLTPKRLIYTVQKPSAIACLHCSGAVWLCLTKARWLP